MGERLSARGFDVLLLEYRGYGRSEGDVDGEFGLYIDANAAYAYSPRHAAFVLKALCSMPIPRNRSRARTSLRAMRVSNDTGVRV